MTYLSKSSSRRGTMNEPTTPADVNISEQRIIHLGKESWRAKKEGADWTGWVRIGQAIDLGRTHAMREAGTNQPKGKTYARIFGDWIKRNGFGDLNEVARAALLECIRHLLKIEEWREGIGN